MPTPQKASRPRRRRPRPRSVAGVTARLDAVEAALQAVNTAVQSLVDRERVQDWYTTDELARHLGKAPFTCREWARRGRIRATKRQSGRGGSLAWVVSHDELARIRQHGLLPSPATLDRP